MKPDDIRQLLGGYATGTLTPEERQMLFAAALEDQELFDSLMREQALKEVLDDPAVRRELIAGLEPKPSWWWRFVAGMRWFYPVAGVGALAVAALTVILLVRQAPRSTEVASVQPAPSIPAAAETAPPSPARREAAPAKPQPKAMSQAALDLPRRAAEPERAAPLAGGVVGGVIGGVPMAVPPPPLPPPAPASRQASPPPPPVATPAAALAPAEAEVRSALAAAEPAPAPKARDWFYQPTGGPSTNASADSARRQATRGFRAMTAAKVGAPPAPAPLGFRYAVEGAAGLTHLLTVESNADATLYLFHRTAAGDWAPVTPGGMSLKSRTPATSPPVEVDPGAALPRVIAVVARAPLSALAQSGAALSATLEGMRKEMAPALADSSGGSNFVVSAGPRPMVFSIDIP